MMARLLPRSLFGRLVLVLLGGLLLAQLATAYIDLAERDQLLYRAGGLGLGIVRSIARSHGGDLTLRNRPGRGLEAMLTLPK